MSTDQFKVVHKNILDNSTSKDKGMKLWMRLLACSRMIEEEIKKILRDEFDMTLPRFELMSALRRVPEGLSMVELSRWLMVTKGNITGIAERLSEDGYIKREPTLTDRRTFCVTLTPKGEETSLKMSKRYEQFVNEMFDGTSQEDIDTFLGLLVRFRENLDNYKEETIDS